MTIWKAGTANPVAAPQQALFLARDGVVIADENYLSDPQLVRLLPGVAQAMINARQEGFLLVGVSNQSGIGRGYFGEQDLHKVMLRLEQLLAVEGTGFDSFHYCPHAPTDGCDCRKPRPGLLNEAKKVQAIDLTQSWMVGDKASDVAFGRAAGMGGVLVRTGYGAAQEEAVRQRWPDDPLVLVAADLLGAVEKILACSAGGNVR